MFNFKKIGITFSILALVGLTGALIAGPVAASEPNVTICHYAEAQAEYWDYDDAGNPTKFHAEEFGNWYVNEVDMESLADHIANHGDFQIMDDDDGVTAAKCADLMLTNLGEAEAEEVEVEEEENEVEEEENEVEEEE